MSTTISIIIPSLGGSKAADAIAYWESYPSYGALYRVEVTPVIGAASMSAALNEGARRAAGDLLVFCHDDITFEDPDATLWHRLEHLFASGVGIAGIAGSTLCSGPRWSDGGPHTSYGQVAHRAPPEDEITLVAQWQCPSRTVGGIKVLDGVWMSCHRRTFDLVNGFDEGFNNWHLYDLDFSLRVYLAGHSNAVLCDLSPLHLSLGTYDKGWEESARRFTAKHLHRLDPAWPHPVGMQQHHIHVSHDFRACMRLPHWED